MKARSVDLIQNTLADEVFHYAKDRKKAAGRALGMLVEVITFYLLTAWQLERHIAIERPLPEYPDSDITHNVEYSLHPAQCVGRVKLPRDGKPVTPKKIVAALRKLDVSASWGELSEKQFLSSKGILRHACVISETPDRLLVAALCSHSSGEVEIVVHRLHRLPFALAECKRVGVEEGNRKGPQTIEKAKQGAYVARSVSALQRIRMADGRMGGVINNADGTFVHKPYEDFLREIIASEDRSLLSRFILTVGVVSNHGNWFTAESQNKEMKVLTCAYDWLIFLTDGGLSQFVDDLLISPASSSEPIRQAFVTSYTPGHRNEFTKVSMSLEADAALRSYFADHIDQIHGWFNVISPRRRDLTSLRDELLALAGKRWEVIHS